MEKHSTVKAASMDLAQAHQVIAQLQAELAEVRKKLGLERQKNDALQAHIHKLQRMTFGQKSERVAPHDPLPSVREQVRKSFKSERSTESARAATTLLRRQNRQAALKLPSVDVIEDVEEAAKQCQSCAKPFRKLGSGEISFTTEWSPGYWVRRRHIREKYVCRCGETIVIAKSPQRVVDKTTYGPGAHAHITVSKCLDSIPLHRQAKIFARQGLRISKNTLGEIFHRVASVMQPIYDLILAEVTQSKNLNADETTIQMQAPGQTQRCYMWVFVSESCMAYIFNVSRSGQTPSNLLHGTTGTLQVDGYTGYSKVCAPDGRTRAGCWAHVRRYFFDASETACHEADYALAQILQMYRVEYRAAEEGCLKTPRHLLMRQELTRPIMERFKAWMQEQKERDHLPKSMMMQAIAYTEKIWPSLLTCLDDVNVYLDNNISERALRQIALGRKNYMFVGSEEAGRNLAINQTIIASCVMADVDPQEYLTDVLIRSQYHPAKDKQQLMPANWKKLFSKSKTQDLPIT